MLNPGIKKYLLPVLVLGIIFPAKELSNVVNFSPKGADLYNVKLIKDVKGNDVYIIHDQSYKEKTIPQITDMVLSFNAPASALVKDDTGKYSIRNASYEFVKNRGVVGAGGALFFKSDHIVEIESERSLWLGNCTDLGSFSIEMRFLPLSIKEGATLFSNVGYSSGKKTGIELVIKSGRLETRLFRLFKDKTGRRLDVFLNRGNPIKDNDWHHFLLSFDRVSGKLSAVIDGEESEVVYVSDNGDPYVGVFEPSFPCEDLPIAVVGKNFYGILDELRISYRHIDDLKKETDIAFRKYRETGLIGRTPVNREGIITSPVYQFPLTGTRTVLFGWNEVLKKDSFVWMEFRISDDLFSMDDNVLKWNRVVNNQRNIYLKKSGDLYLRGKYYQWRAHLVSSPDGNYSPEISEIALHYQLDRAPHSPLFLETLRTGDGLVRLRWKKNVEHDILGYRIYYGIYSKKYDGVISLINGKMITNDMNKDRNYIEVDITNAIIEENMSKDSSGVLNYPILKNNILYYFAVSAYDSYRPDTKYNHESEPSGEITARPFAGSEITN